MLRVATVVALLAVSSSGHAQAPQATFRAGTTLVDFTVVVVDGQGNPITDLRKDEISIIEDSYPRDVAFFQFEGRADVAPTPRATVPAGIFSNRPDLALSAPRNLIAVVVDLINTSPAGQVQLQTELLHYLKQIPPGAHVGLYMFFEHAVAIHDYTQDVEALRARLQRGEIDLTARAMTSTRDVQGMAAASRPEQQASMAALAAADTRGTGDLNMQVAKWRRSATLRALESVARHVAGVPGRKSLVWVSHGFPLTDAFGTYTDSVTATSRLLASQNVAIYPFEDRGVPVAALHDGGLGINDQSRSSTSRGQQPSQGSSNVTSRNLFSAMERGRVQGASEVMAAITGGRVTRNDNDPMASVVAAADDLRGAYSVGFYAAVEPDNRWHRLTVKVSRPGVMVRHRQGYLATSTAIDNTQNWSEAQWNEIASLPLVSTAVRFDARATFTSGMLRTLLTIHADDLQPRQTPGPSTADIDIAVVEKSATAATNVRIRTVSMPLGQGDVPVSGDFTLNPATVAIRLIVRDKSTNRYGSLELPLSAIAAP